ncbi:MAG: glutamine--fructose-6-phosphate transaminase (isomerizing) [Firmicutes bacterium]|nr:glutamine--fructose-6-phosphate transaminase (isomerizing) [Bacillota bacterium]
MCGIVGSVGETKLRDYLLHGLKSLEYRGYDSAGTAFLTKEKIEVFRLPGRIDDLNQLVPAKMHGAAGIGHTRWATHGEPNFVNSHPHCSQQGYFTIVHNGVIDNFRSLKKKLQNQGCKFQSETDTEVIANLMEMHYLKAATKNPLDAIKKTLEDLEGSYALAILFKMDDTKVYFAKLHSPLVIGKGKNTNYLASDYVPMLDYATSYYILDDYQYGYISQKEVVVKHLDPNEEKPLVFHQTDLKVTDIGLNGYPHYMLKEIEESPEVIKRLMDNYVDGNQFVFDDVLIQKIQEADQIIFLACGTSYHAALVGRRYFESIGKTSRVYIASEFAYYPEVKGKHPLFIFISQSGETADLIRCVKIIQQQGSPIVTITNTKGSSLDRASDFTLLLYAGMEIAVASTKAYIAQVALLAILRAALIGNTEIITDLIEVEKAMKGLIGAKLEIKAIAEAIAKEPNVFFLGRGLDYDVALEASLKLKEITYIHSEGLPGGELKHGPIALIKKNVPVIAFVSDQITSTAIRSNLQEVLARGAKVYVVSNQALAKEEDDFVTSNTKTYLSPLTKAIVGQYLSYYTALSLGRDIDKPRNLAKSVTVE